MTLTAKQRNIIMSSKFENALKNTLNDVCACTENGACGFKTAGNPLLDINFAVSSLRSKSNTEVEKMFSDAFYFNPLLATKWLFMLRDVRFGLGERRSFRICFKWLANTRPEIVKKLIPLVAEYGRFDDIIYSGLEGELWDNVVDIVVNQLEQDVKNMEAGKPVSLMAKWLPSCNTSSRSTVAIARKLIASLGMSEKQYRKTLAKLRAYLKVIEVKMSAKQWSEIDYEAVPSKANCKYNSAFLRNDETRRRAFLDALEKGEAKINSSANFPCDIVHAYTKNSHFGWYRYRIESEDAALEAMWKALPEVKINGNLICCCDGSGSMTVQVDPHSKMTALDVCNALGIYCSEHLTGPFKNKYITFSNHPQYVDFTNAKSLAEKLNIAYEHDECASTNIEAVMDLMLETSIRNHLKQEDIPDLCIISDMEFNSAIDFGGGYSYWNRPSDYSASKNALFERIRQKWEAAGYKLPRIIFWNVNSRTGTIPLQQNENGVVLCSGFSQTQFKMLMSNKTDPYEVLVEALNVERYQPVEDAVKTVL